MSVIVMGMEMPQRCMGCTLCYVGHMGDLMCEVLRRPINVDETGRDRFCPLIEILTPHGRLIDADELSKQKYENIWTNRLVINADDLDDAPTVIEAEE